MAAADREGLREALARVIDPFAFAISGFVLCWPSKPQRRAVAFQVADALIAGPLAENLAQAVAERDEARARLLIVTDDRDEQRRARLDAEADAETTDRWRQRALAAEGRVADVTRLSAEVEALRAALAPFVDAIKVNDDDTLSRLKSDNHVVWAATGSWSTPATVTIGHFRALREAARTAGKDETGDGKP